MIGLFGVVADPARLEPSARGKAFEAMLSAVDRADFDCERIEGRSFSIGAIKRKRGGNRDLAVRKVSADSAVAFNGYGKFAGEKRFAWADAMIDRLIPAAGNQKNWAFEKLEGSFECIVVDANELFIVSDRLGSKRLFYYDDERATVFAPDVIRIVSSRQFAIEKNLAAALQVLMSGFFLDDSTLIKGIDRFPYATVFAKNIDREQKGTKKKYWNLPPAEGRRPETADQLIDEMAAKMDAAVGASLALDRRAVVPLSGGLDSRAIACFVSRKTGLKTVTYDLRDEVGRARKVCRRLGGEAVFFTNDMLHSGFFKRELRQLVVDQKLHVVPNQYFYTPLFKKYFQDHPGVSAIFDGVYLGILFSAPYTYPAFDFDDFARIYCGGLAWVSRFCSGFDRKKLRGLAELKYEELLSGFAGGADGVAKSQLFYVSGRLRRYVSESYLARENYCYTFKPGFDYDLMDFGFSLKLPVRRGRLYVQMLGEKFPQVMTIRYKDSYGNRKKTWGEHLHSAYRKMRLKASYGTNGLFKYYPYQADRFFYTSGEIARLCETVLKKNYVEELLDKAALRELASAVERKQYLFNFFQRVLFLQAFYGRVFA